jgi:hypothetical protein
MPKATKGDAILRIALAGADGGNGTAPSVAGNLTIGVNGKEVGTLHPVATNALRYNTDKGVWNQYVQKFDASLLKPGENSVTFTVPAGDVTTRRGPGLPRPRTQRRQQGLPDRARQRSSRRPCRPGPHHRIPRT